MSKTRPLTPQEHKALNLVKLYEESTDKHCLVVYLEGTKEAAEGVAKLQEAGICRCIRVEYMPATERYKIVYSLSEFEKHMFYMLRVQGLTLRIDGSATTADGYLIKNDYLQGDQR